MTQGSSREIHARCHGAILGFIWLAGLIVPLCLFEKLEEGILDARLASCDAIDS